MTKFLLVCMGNICRSPMAETIARKMAAVAGLSAGVIFDSAGTHANHMGERPDPRAVEALIHRGYEMRDRRSRKITLGDFQHYDVILAMDDTNLRELRRICPSEHSDKLGLFLTYTGTGALGETEVPDPYFGNAQGFERVVDLCEAGASALIRQLK